MLALGIVFLCTSESVEDVILNAVAINFISDIDEVLLAALIPKASKQRLLKYRFDGCRTSVEDGDTQMKTATETTKLVARFAGVAPLFWLVFSVGIVVGGQFWAKTLPSVVSGEVECRWLVPRHG